MVVEFYFHPQSSECQPIRVILQELGIDHKDIEEDVLWDNKSAEFLKVNPRGKVPTIKDGDLILTESRAIAIYLCTKCEPIDKPNKLYPRDPEKMAKMNEAIFAELDDYCYVDKYMNGYDVWFSRGSGPLSKYSDMVKNFLRRIEGDLEKHKFLFADYITIVDFFALSTIELLDMADREISAGYPRVQAWRKALAELPYYDEYFAKPNAKSAAYYKKVNNEFLQKQKTA